MGFVTLPDGILPTFDRAPNNWANFIDVNILGNHIWKKDYDPEGLLSTLPAIATSLIGVLIGKLLLSHQHLKIAIIGLFILLSGYIWDLWFPINKALWSSSFVLVTAGWGALFLSSLHYFIDIRKIHFGNIFKYIGSNAIVIFFMSSFIAKIMGLIKVNGTESIHSWLYSFYTTIFSSDKLSSVSYALTVALFYCTVGYFLYKKKIFIKI